MSKVVELTIEEFKQKSGRIGNPSDLKEQPTLLTRQWPQPIGSAAYYGTVGEIVELIYQQLFGTLGIREIYEYLLKTTLLNLRMLTSLLLATLLPMNCDVTLIAQN